MSRRINAVCGFMFSEDRRKVALIRKNRPPFQAGKLNGIGGKMERGEQPIDTMVREFHEETGYVTSACDWELYVRLMTPGWHIRFFRKLGADLSQLRSLTDEKVEVHNVSTLSFQETLRNVQWLVPMALDDSEYSLPHVIRETESQAMQPKAMPGQP